MSLAWKNLKKVPGTESAECQVKKNDKVCGEVKKCKSGSTSDLLRHLKLCHSIGSAELTPSTSIS